MVHKNMIQQMYCTVTKGNKVQDGGPWGKITKTLDMTCWHKFIWHDGICLSTREKHGEK